MRALVKHQFPMMAPLVTAGIVRVDDPNASCTDPVRETARPHAHGKQRRITVSTKTAMTLAAMSAKKERENNARSTDEEDQEIDKRLVRDQETP